MIAAEELNFGVEKHNPQQLTKKVLPGKAKSTLP